MRRFSLIVMLQIALMLCNMITTEELRYNSAHAQNVTFFTSKEGLVNTCVQTIYEDSRNNIWISTRHGLNRYDGVLFHKYNWEDGNPHSLVDDIVMLVKEYDHNNILVGTSKGLQMYDYGKDNFSTIPYITHEGDTVQPHISDICKMSEGQIYICAVGHGCGLLKKDDHGRFHVKQVLDFVYDGNDISPINIFRDKKGREWAIGWDNNVYLKKGKTCVRLMASGNTKNICESSSGKVYIGEKNLGLMQYNEKSGDFVAIAQEQTCKNLWSIAPFKDGRIFICTDGSGLKVYNENTGLVKQSSLQINSFNIANSNVKDALVDSYGNIWVGIYWKGVMMQSASHSRFNYIGRNSITRNTIGMNSVTAVEPCSQGGVWVATDHDGIHCINADGTSSKHWEPTDTPTDAPSTFNVLKEDRCGRLWMGGFSDGLWSMEINTGKFTRFNSNISQILSMCRPRNGFIWIATIGNGFYGLDTQKGELTHYDNTCEKLHKPANFTPNQYIYSIMQNGDRLYIGTISGVEVYKYYGDAQLEYVNTVMSNYNVICTKQDPNDKNTVWIGTNKGLASLNATDLTSKKFTKADGLPCDMITSLAFQEKDLWVGTVMGLSCMVDCNPEKFNNYYLEDGIQDNEFMQRASCVANGNLYFGGISGITYFDKINKHSGEDNIGKLSICELYVHDRAIHEGDMSGSYQILDGFIDDVSEINLSHTDNSISFYLSLTGSKSAHVHYEGSLDGEQWSCLSHGERLILPELSTGTHKLKLRARVGDRMTEERTLTIIIHDPWYASTLAYMLYLVILLIIAYAVFIYVRQQMAARHILQHHRQQHKINETRIQFFMNISHEIRTPMTLIMAPIEKLLATDNDPVRQKSYQLIKQNGNRVLRLVNQILDIRKIEMGQFQLDCTQQDVVKLLQGACNVFKTTADEHKIDFQFTHEGISQLQASVDMENFDKIMMNLLSNAFKFTPDGGKIVVRLGLEDAASPSEPYYTISVTDSGIGISDEDKPKVFQRFFSAVHQNGYVGTGIGMNLTSLLVKLHKGDIKVMDNPDGQGAKFVVTLPIEKVEVHTDVYNNTAEETGSETTGDAATEKTKPQKAQGPAVVLVDDEPSIREYVQSELSSDMSVTCFSNGQEALDYILNDPNKVNLVISDVMMPVMDGSTLCHNIKSRTITNHIPVILMTALNSDKDRIEGLKTGADAYIAKPFNIDVLHTTALNLVHSHHILQTKYTSNEKAKEIIEEVEITSPDEKLLQRVLKAINENLDNSEFTIEDFADKVGVSRVHLYRKMKELTGQSPRDYIRNIRLQEAARLLSEKHLDISEVAYRTGFKSLSAFSATFKELYGMSPTEWMKKNKK